MNILDRVSKVFAVLFLIFVNFLVSNAQPDSIYRVRAGTRIMLSMDSEISSKVASVNDTFTAKISKPLLLRDAVVLPVGTVIEGRVVRVSSAKFGRRNGKLEIRFETMRFSDSQQRRIEGLLVNELKTVSSSTADVLTVFGGTALGAVLGAASGKQSGTLIGAGAGAGVGTGVLVLRKGKDVYIRTNEEFEIELKSDVSLPVSEY
jgi:hypothetical protein